MKTILFAVMFMLVIGLSTGTAKACSPPTSIQSPSGDIFLCFGNGTAGDYPAGVSDNGDDANCHYGTYGTECYTCLAGYTQDSQSICRAQLGGGGACDSSTAGEWWYLYYQGYFPDNLYFWFNCYPSDYYGALKIPKIPFKTDKPPVENAGVVNILPYGRA